MKPRYTMGCGLPLNPPILPMLAKPVDELHAQGDWIFEPKWDALVEAFIICLMGAPFGI